MTKRIKMTKRLLLALMLVLVAGASWAQPSGGYNPSTAKSGWFPVPAGFPLSTIYYTNTLLDGPGQRIRSFPCVWGTGGCAGALVDEFIDVNSTGFPTGYSIQRGLMVYLTVKGTLGANFSPTVEGINSSVECSHTTDSTGRCYAYGGNFYATSNTKSAVGVAISASHWNTDTVNATSETSSIGASFGGGGLAGRYHKFETNLLLNGISGGNEAADPQYSFKLMAVNNRGRVLFSAAGTDTSCQVATVKGMCIDKENIPGYALGQDFAIELRGGRGTLMSGGTGQWQVVDGGTRPICDVAHRGAYWHEFSGAGVKDTVEVCAKDAGNAYAWRTLY